MWACTLLKRRWQSLADEQPTLTPPTDASGCHHSLEEMQMIRSMPCPSCGTFDLTRSRRRGFDFLVTWLGLYPYRCQRCDQRCYRYRREHELRSKA